MIERTILSSLVHDENYARKVLPYIKSEYFQNKSEQVVFNIIFDHINRYNTIPSVSTLFVELNNRKTNIDEHEFKEVSDIVTGLQTKQECDLQWLVDKTEAFCQEKAIYNGIIESVRILNDKSGKMTKHAIPGILQNALAVSFDTHIGVDLINDADDWFERVRAPHIRVPFDLDMMNKITKDGLLKKTLNLFMGGVGFGKTLWMCHLAGANLLLGKNVLYITLEMSEDQISERIYANMLNVPLDQLDIIPKDVFLAKVDKLKEKTTGKLIVHEYPTSGAGAANFRHLLNELKIKKNFIPDIVYIDYLNICISNRVKFSPQIGMYLYVKMISEEIRGLAIEQNVPIVSATQINREGFTASDPGMENISESFALAATADLILIIVVSDELIKLGQYMIKQVKNRYSDMNKNNKFVIGVDRSKMRLYNVEQKAQTLIQPPTSNEPKSISERAMAMVHKPKFDFKDFK